MEEEPKNEKKTEFKGNLGFIWLVGILVILLGCTIVYTLKISKENKELKQAPVQQTVQPVAQTPITTEEQSKETNTNKVVKEDITKYKGTWYQYENMDYLKIKSISDGKIVFDWFIYRTDEYDNVTATLNEENIAYFTSKDDLDTHEISGKIILKDNTVTAEVVKLIDKESPVEKGYSITFDKKKELIEGKKEENTAKVNKQENNYKKFIGKWIVEIEGTFTITIKEKNGKLDIKWVQNPFNLDPAVEYTVKKYNIKNDKLYVEVDTKKHYPESNYIIYKKNNKMYLSLESKKGSNFLMEKK